MKKILMTGISAGLLVASSAALAVPVVLPAGTITFTFSGVDAATTNYPPSTARGEICGWQANAPASGSNCDSVGPSVTSPTPGAMATPSGPKEDTWGVARITALVDQNGQFWSPSPGDYITAMFYGLYDVGVERGNSTTATYSAEGFLDIYSMPVDPGAYPNPQTRTSFSSFPGYTGTAAQLLLSLRFTTGEARITNGTYAGGGAPFGSTLTGSFSNNSLGGGSISQLAVSVVGGLWGEHFDTNTYTGANGEKNDFLLSTTFRRCPSTTQCNSVNTPGQTVFSVWVDGGMDGYYGVISEPATIGLLSLGLLSVGTFARRRR